MAKAKNTTVKSSKTDNKKLDETKKVVSETFEKIEEKSNEIFDEVKDPIKSQKIDDVEEIELTKEEIEEIENVDPEELDVIENDPEEEWDEIELTKEEIEEIELIKEEIKLIKEEIEEIENVDPEEPDVIENDPEEELLQNLEKDKDMVEEEDPENEIKNKIVSIETNQLKSEILDILKSQSYYSYLICGRHLNNKEKTTDNDLKNFYKEFVVYGISTKIDSDLLSLLKQYFNI
jgi:hypothetical protein